MRYFLFLCLIFCLCSSSVEASTPFKGFLLNENSIVVYSIEDLFDGVCLSEFGKQTLYLIKNCDIKAENITYIGYGFSSRYKNSSNVIVFYVYDK